MGALLFPPVELLITVLAKSRIRYRILREAWFVLIVGRHMNDILFRELNRLGEFIT